LVRALKDNLEAEGCVIDVAANGEEALERIRSRKPDLILLDLLMPKQDGFFCDRGSKKKFKMGINPHYRII